MPVLLVDLLAHGAGQALEAAGGAVQGVEVGVDLVLHLVVVRVGLELVLGALGQVGGLIAAGPAAAHGALRLLLALLRLERRRARVLALLLLLAVRVHDGLVAGLAALGRGEGVGDVHAVPYSH